MTTTPTWRTAPGLPSRRTGLPRFAGWVAAMLIAVAGPVAWALTAAQPWWSIELCGYVGATVLRTRIGRSPRVVIGVALVAGLVVGVTSTSQLGLWVGIGLLLGRWVTATRGRPFVVAVPPSSALGTLALSLLAGGLALWGAAWWQVGLVVLGSVLLPVSTALGGGRPPRAIEWFAHGVGTGVTRVLFGVASLPLVLVPHVVGRVLRVDGFDATGHWARPPRRADTAAAPWAQDRPRRARSAGRLAGGLVVAVAMAVLAWQLVAGLGSGDRSNGFTLAAPGTGTAVTEPTIVLKHPAPRGVTQRLVPDGQVPAALHTSPWWSSKEFSEPMSLVMAPQALWRFENPYRMLDMRSRYINIVNGIRATWSPPPCTCKRLTVWMYGGSTTWGIDQRDDHTIASELARVAHEHGLTVDVQNRGLPGFNQWEESERFAWDLTVDPKPDLVIFYDGVNDSWWDFGLYDHIFEQIWHDSHRGDPPVPDGPPGAELLPPRKSADDGIQLTADGVHRYDLTRRYSEASAKQHGIPAVYFWQPTRYDRAFVAAEPHFDTERENEARRGRQYAASQLPHDVIDLTGALEGTTAPIFTDDAHHNELGARLIAQAMYPHLADELASLSGG